MSFTHRFTLLGEREQPTVSLHYHGAVTMRHIEQHVQDVHYAMVNVNGKDSISYVHTANCLTRVEVCMCGTV